jgi:hypothetical protein
MLTAVILAGCGGSTAAPLAAFSSPPRTMPSTVAPSPLTSTPPTRGLTSGVPARCTDTQLTISIVKTAAGGGSVTAVLGFKNSGSTACTLKGWPQVTARGPGVSEAHAHRVATVMGAPIGKGDPVVTLAPGETAEAAIAGGDISGSNQAHCPPPYKTFAVRAPEGTTSVTLSAWISYANSYMPSCAGGLNVTPVLPTEDFQNS